MRSGFAGIGLVSRRALLGMVPIAAALFLPATREVANAQTIEYLLRPSSYIRELCDPCPDGAPRHEELHGRFELTVLAIPDVYAIEAVTGVSWHSANFRINGTGFLERLGRHRTSMVIDALINDQPVLLTSSSHPTDSDGNIRLTLTSAPGAANAVEIELVGFANATDGPDADGDGIPDVLDLCPLHPESRQQDSDLDGVGDACDECPETVLGAPVLSNGCSVDQICPCAGPRPGELWEDQRAYVTCVARSLKVLAIAGEIARDQARQITQAAVRSGCGMPVIAFATR